jgi:hypothetical protein
MDLWKISDNRLVPLDKSTLKLEERLEDWLEKDISLIDDDVLVIGRQVYTEYGGYIDLLAVSSETNGSSLELAKSAEPSYRRQDL